MYCIFSIIISRISIKFVLNNFVNDSNKVITYLRLIFVCQYKKQRQEASTVCLRSASIQKKQGKPPSHPLHDAVKIRSNGR